MNPEKVKTVSKGSTAWFSNFLELIVHHPVNNTTATVSKGLRLGLATIWRLLCMIRYPLAVECNKTRIGPKGVHHCWVWPQSGTHFASTDEPLPFNNIESRQRVCGLAWQQFRAAYVSSDEQLRFNFER